jgi:V-type H+-transporting ATPase subunit a
VDPVWYVSEQEIQFLNSFKMKISVILGILQMSLGIVQKGLNAKYRGDKLEFLHEFVPQLTMLLCLFGYMDLLIIIKWLTNYLGQEHTAPSIITTMVGMFLESGRVQGQPLFWGQQAFSICMVRKFFSLVTFVWLVIVSICVPWMLLAKPLLLRQEHIKRD